MTEDISVPAAVFVDDVAGFLKGKPIESVIAELQSNLQKYKFIESQLQIRRSRLKTKLPELQKTLDIVDVLIAKADSGDVMKVDYQLSDQVFAKAKLKDVKTVNLWLGAGVMVEYTLEDAKQLLETNIAQLQENLEINQQNLDMVKDSTTITEVTIARVYNHDVEQRRAQKQKA